jgi:hypothetical protein
MTDDLDLEMASLKKAATACEAVTQQNWGRAARIKLPGGGTLACASRAMRDRKRPRRFF